MNEKQLKIFSKMLSYILRHRPDSINLELDENGWASVEELLVKVTMKDLTKSVLEQIVSTNDKQRFAFNADKTKIRASQGHSIDVSLDLSPQTPPEILYHGTVDKFLDAIQKEGLQKMNRQHVHLSKDKETAVKVGSRRGKPVILEVQADEMQQQGYTFYLSDNEVWLTDHVPAMFIGFDQNINQ